MSSTTEECMYEVEDSATVADLLALQTFSEEWRGSEHLQVKFQYGRQEVELSDHVKNAPPKLVSSEGDQQETPSWRRAVDDLEKGRHIGQMAEPWPLPRGCEPLDFGPSESSMDGFPVEPKGLQNGDYKDDRRASKRQVQFSPPPSRQIKAGPARTRDSHYEEWQRPDRVCSGMGWDARSRTDTQIRRDRRKRAKEKALQTSGNSGVMEVTVSAGGIHLAHSEMDTPRDCPSPRNGQIHDRDCVDSKKIANGGTRPLTFSQWRRYNRKERLWRLGLTSQHPNEQYEPVDYGKPSVNASVRLPAIDSPHAQRKREYAKYLKRISGKEEPVYDNNASLDERVPSTSGSNLTPAQRRRARRKRSIARKLKDLDEPEQSNDQNRSADKLTTPSRGLTRAQKRRSQRRRVAERKGSKLASQDPEPVEPVELWNPQEDAGDCSISFGRLRSDDEVASSSSYVSALSDVVNDEPVQKEAVIKSSLLTTSRVFDWRRSVHTQLHNTCGEV